MLMALSACSDSSDPTSTRGVEDVQPTSEVVIEARAVAALAANTVVSQSRPVDVSVDETDSSTEVYVRWKQDAPVTLVRVVLAANDRAIVGACDEVDLPCESGSSDAGDFVVLRSSKRTVEGFRQSDDGGSLTMTAYGTGDTFEVVQALLTNRDLNWTVPESVNLDNRWTGRLSPVRIGSDAEKVSR